MQRSEQDVLLHAGGIRFDALKDARMKGMKEIAVAQEKADHFCASLENPAGLRIGAESQTPDGGKHSRTRFPAYLRAGIQHAGNRSDANGSGLGNLANRRFPWNCFHSDTAFCHFGVWLGSVRNRRTPLARASLAHQNGCRIVNGQHARGSRSVTRSWKTDARYWFHEESDLTEGFRSDRVWNQFQHIAGSSYRG